MCETQAREIEAAMILVGAVDEEKDELEVEALQDAQVPEATDLDLVQQREPEKDDQQVEAMVVGAHEEQKHEKQVDGKKDEWRNEGRGQMNWMKQCSKHLLHIEGRLMEQGYLAHEVLRQVRSNLRHFAPPPRGSWSWLMRTVTDLCVRFMRQLWLIYFRNQENEDQFMGRVWALVRLVVEEAWHRNLKGEGCGP